MVTYNRLTAENRKVCETKAKTKKDGIYQFRGIAYRVRNNLITHFACNGYVVIPYGHFDVEVGYYQGYLSEAIKILKGI